MTRNMGNMEQFVEYNGERIYLCTDGDVLNSTSYDEEIAEAEREQQEIARQFLKSLPLSFRIRLWWISLWMRFLMWRHFRSGVRRG